MSTTDLGKGGAANANSNGLPFVPTGVAVYNRNSRDKTIFLTNGTIIKIKSNVALSSGKEFCWVIARGVNSQENVTIFEPERLCSGEAEKFLDTLAEGLRRAGWTVIDGSEA